MRPLPHRRSVLRSALRSVIRTRLGIAFVLIGLLAAAAVPCGWAQPVPNTARFEAIALDCLGTAPGEARAFRLDAPAAMPYLRTALLARWQTDGRTVYLADSTGGPSLPVLQYRIEEVEMAYERAGRKRLRRTATLALRHTLTAADGRLLAEAPCRDARTDDIARADVPMVESPFPETKAEVPPGGFFRRYLEPAVLTAATAVGVYLFFTLRSDRNEGG